MLHLPHPPVGSSVIIYAKTTVHCSPGSSMGVVCRGVNPPANMLSLNDDISAAGERKCKI
jgi:hypothetical protein